MARPWEPEEREPADDLDAVVRALWPAPYESPIEEKLGRVMRNRLPIVQPQAQIGRHRVDFLVSMPFPNDPGRPPSMAVVECDGQEFHTNVSKDATRDRELTALGLAVIRFTGSEIHRDVEACVQRIEDILINQDRRAWK